jgi:hypothetical protein
MAAPKFTWSFNTAPAGPFSGDVSFSTGLFVDNKFVPAAEGGVIEYAFLQYDDKPRASLS